MRCFVKGTIVVPKATCLHTCCSIGVEKTRGMMLVLSPPLHTSHPNIPTRKNQNSLLLYNTRSRYLNEKHHHGCFRALENWRSTLRWMALLRHPKASSACPSAFVLGSRKPNIISGDVTIVRHLSETFYLGSYHYVYKALM